MKIGIDVFGCQHGQSGAGSYIRSLVKNLPCDNDCTYDLFGPEIDRYTFDSGGKQISYSGFNIGDNLPAKKLWHTVHYHSVVAKKKYDAILFPAGLPVVSPKHSIPSVVVIHDILSDVFQSYSGSLAVLLRKRQLKHCSKIIAASQFIKKDLLKLHINPEKIEVIYNGVDHNLFYPRTADSLVDQSEDIAYIQPFAIKRPYIIYASRLSKPEKKHAELIKAFSLFKKNTGLPHKLVLAGNENPYAEHIHRLVSASAYSSDILITGHFPHENFFDLYAFSDACVFPSVREGVGLPVIEAMASGIPVACADAGSLREIAGDFALYFNPDDIESFAKAIEQIIIDKKLRQTLVKGGIDRTKRFSWEKTAQKTVDLLKSL